MAHVQGVQIVRGPFCACLASTCGLLERGACCGHHVRDVWSGVSAAGSMYDPHLDGSEAK